MHILEQYALNCGVSIDKPFILEELFPIPFENYITIHPKGKFPSREYDYWEEVVINLSPILEKYNIKIVQVGAKEDQPLPFCYHTQGQTTFNSLAYIIKNSMLHIGIDSFPIHLASYYDKKIIGLYCNMYPSQSGPYWSKSEDCELLMAELNNKKPSYSAMENPKTINTIRPENIINGVLRKLSLNENYKVKSLFVGEAFHIKTIEIIPDHLPNLQSFGIDVANVRMDLNFNEDMLLNIMNAYKTNIVTTKAINLEKIARFKNRILNIYYILEDINDFNIEFLENLKVNGFKFVLVSFLPEQETQQIKIHTMDLGNIIVKDFNRNKKILSEIQGKNLRFKSSKLLLSQGKIYPTVENLINSEPYGGSLTESFKLKKDSILYKDLDAMYIFDVD